MTLAEAAVLLLVVAIVASVAAVRSAAGLGRARLATSARRAACVFLEARDAAMAAGRVVVVECRPGASRAALRRKAAPGRDEEDEVLGWISLPEGCRFGAGGDPILRFLPDGGCEGALVTLVEGDGRSLGIEFHPVLGLPSVASETPRRVVRARAE